MHFPYVSLLAGVGFCLSHQPAVVVNPLYFVKYRTLILGLTFSGAGFGTVIYPWICRLCINAFGWRGALMICAGVNLHNVVLAMFIPRYSPLEKRAAMKNSEIKNEGQEKMTETRMIPTSKIKKFLQHFDLLNNTNFILLCFNNFFFQFGMYIVYTHIAAYAHSLNFGETVADLLISLVGASNLAGRAGFGIIGHHPRVDVPLLFFASYFASGLSVIGCGFWRSVIGISICSCLFGFLCGSCGPLMCEFTCSVVGAKHFNKAYGFMMIFMAFGNLIGAPVAGKYYLFYEN